MSLRGARVERLIATFELESEQSDQIELRNEFTVVVRAQSGEVYRYGSGPGIAPVDRGPLEQLFDFLARDSLSDLVRDMRIDDDYDGPDPLDRLAIEWHVSKAAGDAFRRLRGT